MASTSRPVLLKLQEEPVHKCQIQKDNIKTNGKHKQTCYVKLHEAGGTSLVTSPQIKKNTNDKPVILKLHKSQITKTDCHVRMRIQLKY